jgi:arylsulfatase
LSASTRTSRGAPADQGQHADPVRQHGAPVRNSIVSIKNKSYAITADVDVPESGAEGVIVAQGGSTNGWSLYAKSGRLKYCYNFFGINLTMVEGRSRSPPAITRCVWVQVRRRRAKGGAVTLYVDGKAVGQGRVDQTVPMAFSGDETCDVGKGPAHPCPRTTVPMATRSAARSTGSRSTSRRTTTIT